METVQMSSTAMGRRACDGYADSDDRADKGGQCSIFQEHGIAANYEDGFVYWSEKSKGNAGIYKSMLDGSAFRYVVSVGMEIVEDLAIDWLDKLRAVFVYPGKGVLFWSDWGSSPHIGSAGMDGSQWTNPNGLVVDETIQRIYWREAKLNRIESLRIDGSDRKILCVKVTHRTRFGNTKSSTLQTGRPVCMSFTLEGRGEHYTHPQQRQPKEGKAINYGVVLLLGVESVTVGSTTGVPMSPGPVYVNCGVVLLLVAVLKYYTTEASEYYTIYAAARCITKEPETHPQQRPISMSFTLEGRGDHYENLSMRWFNSGAVLLFGVVSLKVGSTTGLLMSSGHGGDKVDVAGDGSTKTKIKMNTKWLSLAAIVPAENDAARPVLTQPLHHRIDSFT
ncbi:hypothetical protein DAPPUDRAFT_237349 [Daphnia pulex]|uniref:Uncharacterized protein n=1 Tax=Daphnia pulex TaxID=6669 RepID=E9G3P6_DAPPU|nr:hypothetical protein DAPPUDRAFT_237349 [Daphnia pulex]|eukprot:EFX85945.1 hypothetical protein DAPPUDRAFT_237349 [Daphnia pulex]